ncbi:hypothetical protein LX36DRAFT_649679 [Colletotrichum falcatum]|nr:hypothetical protein LX36DRAFT_649679 [Colletotrichum falcatum]
MRPQDSRATHPPGYQGLLLLRPRDWVPTLPTLAHCSLILCFPFPRQASLMSIGTCLTLLMPTTAFRQTHAVPSDDAR